MFLLPVKLEVLVSADPLSEVKLYSCLLFQVGSGRHRGCDGPGGSCGDPPAASHPPGFLQGHRSAEVLQLCLPVPALFPHQLHVAVRRQLGPGAVRLRGRRRQAAAPAQREARDFPRFD